MLIFLIKVSYNNDKYTSLKGHLEVFYNVTVSYSPNFINQWSTMLQHHFALLTVSLFYFICTYYILLH